jgi:phenylalanyl-tRNA synthetase beta chain
MYCERKFEVEPVEVITPDEKSVIYPDLSIWNLEIDLPYISRSIGVPLKENEVRVILIMISELLISIQHCFS